MTTEQCSAGAARLALEMEEGPMGHGRQVPLETGIGKKTDSFWSLQKEPVLPQLAFSSEGPISSF